MNPAPLACSLHADGLGAPLSERCSVINRADDEWAAAELLASKLAESTTEEPATRVMIALAILLQQHLCRAIKASLLEPHDRYSNLSTLLSVVINDIASRSGRPRS